MRNYVKLISAFNPPDPVTKQRSSAGVYWDKEAFDSIPHDPTVEVFQLWLELNKRSVMFLLQAAQGGAPDSLYQFIHEGPPFMTSSPRKKWSRGH